MGYKLSYGLYIGKWVFPSHETPTIYSPLETLTIYSPTETLLYTHQPRPYYILTNRDPTIYSPLETLTIYSPTETLLYTLTTVPYCESLLSLYIGFQISVINFVMGYIFTNPCYLHTHTHTHTHTHFIIYYKTTLN